MAGRENVAFFEGEVERLVARAAPLEQEAAVVTKELAPDPVDWKDPRQRVAALSEGERHRYDAWEHKRRSALDDAATQLRHLRDVTLKAVGGGSNLDIAREREGMHRRLDLAKKYMETPFPGRGRLAPIQAARREADEQLESAQKRLRALHDELSRYESKRADVLLAANEAAAGAQDPAAGMPQQLVGPLLGQLELKLQRPLERCSLKFQAVQEALMQRIGVAGNAATALAQLEAEAQSHEDTYAAFQQELQELEETLASSLLRSKRETTAEAQRLRGLALDAKTQLPLADGKLQSITEIYSLKPPPTLQTGWGSILNPFAGAVAAQTWFATTFANIGAIPLQLMHLWNPMTSLARLVAFGANFHDACRAVGLCASSHLRFGRNVQVFVPSQASADFLLNVATRERFDVNLQQLYVGLRREPNADGKDLERLHANYTITPVPQGTEAPAPEKDNDSFFYLFLEPGSLPEQSNKKKQRKGHSLVLLENLAPYGSLDEALRSLGLPEDKGVSRADVRKSLVTEVFQLPKEGLRLGKITHMKVPPIVRGREGREGKVSLALFEAHYAVGLPYAGADTMPARFERDADIERVTPAATTLVHSVMRIDVEHRGEALQVIYVGGDSHETHPDLTRVIMRMFIERFGYQAPDKVGRRHNDEEARVIATCSSVAEWKRLMAMPEKPSILVVPRVQDPAFQMAVRNRIAVAHIYVPASYRPEKKRVLRQLSAKANIVYDWPKAVIGRQILLRPKPINQAEELQRLAKGVCINRTEVLRVQGKKKKKKKKKPSRKSGNLWS